VIYSYFDGRTFVARYDITVPSKEASAYIAKNMAENESVLVLCASNLFSADMVRFYLYANDSFKNKVLQYPELPIDSFKTEFQVGKVEQLCRINNVKYLLLHEFGATIRFFNSTLSTKEVFEMLLDSGNFTFETILKGSYSNNIAIFSFRRSR
jgi:hypothetical protein